MFIKNLYGCVAERLGNGLQIRIMQVRILSPIPCSARLSVRTLPFHGKKSGSIPLPSTILKYIGLPILVGNLGALDGRIISLSLHEAFRWR